MNTLSRFAAFTLAAAISTSTAGHADGLRFGQVQTHPSQGEVSVVSKAEARLHTSTEGIHVSMYTKGLAPGHVHTLWLVTINNPGACEATPCTSKDVLKRTTEVDADVGYAGGIVVGNNGRGQFAAYQPIGDLSGAWFEAGLKNTSNVEVHLVVNDHGPVIPSRLPEMLKTYRDGCTDESIPAPMPASARAQGEPGPNACRLVQFSIFEPEETPS
ncbi:hypothetical protein O2N63_06495 [Aliiroseovarius sp. KMU-50]|uniref:Uncharacterized protein n=1 Tax=Aliiroseovarius salicola TaxID=3009082 RepID=A0ABT4VZP3_9RHOB|nr:hypothetical protein [Aliiroseovarius sp. KMU-50]MDA5093734.1 hypothetical protein [Aliiroseovarius sp. KMU-50]